MISRRPCHLALACFFASAGCVAGRGLKVAQAPVFTAGGPAPAPGVASGAPAPAPGKKKDWTPPAPPPFVGSLYDKNGMDWEQGMCFSRERQSPVNFDDHLKDPPSEVLRYHYEPLKNVMIQMQAKDGLIFVDTSNLLAGAIFFNGHEYPLVRIDFHVGGEHLFKGDRPSMEIQLIHRRIDDPTKTLVVAVPVWSEIKPKPKPIPRYLFSKRPVGEYFPPDVLEIDHNSQIQSFLTKRPPYLDGQVVNFVIPWTKPLDLGSLIQNPLLPDSGSYIQYSGSMTTPPCSDMTTWFVKRNPVIAASGQTQAFGNSIFRLTNKFGNFRAVMPFNQRVLAVYKAIWTPTELMGHRRLSLGPNARTDGEYQAQLVSSQAHELSVDASDYMMDFSNRMATSANNLTQAWEKARAELAVPPNPELGIHENATWVDAVVDTRQALHAITHSLEGVVDQSMRKQTMKLHKLAAKEAEEARMLTKAFAKNAPPPQR